MFGHNKHHFHYPKATRIVIDSTGNSGVIKNLRTMEMIKQLFGGNVDGLEEFYLSGSATPHAKDWEAVKKLIVKTSRGNHEKMIALDLREESHIYLNDLAINLNAPDNAVNLGKTAVEIIRAEQEWLESLKSKKLLPDVVTHAEYRNDPHIKGYAMPVYKVDTVETVVKRHQFEYIRFNVTDHRRPDDSRIDSLVQLVTSLEKNTWVHVFCREGVGRTTTILTMIDMLKNADKLSFDEIIARQASVAPYCDLTQTKRKVLAYTPFYVERYELLQEFYQFASERLEGLSENWTTYKAKKIESEDTNPNHLSRNHKR